MESLDIVIRDALKFAKRELNPMHDLDRVRNNEGSFSEAGKLTAKFYVRGGLLGAGAGGLVAYFVDGDIAREMAFGYLMGIFADNVQYSARQWIDPIKDLINKYIH